MLLASADIAILRNRQVASFVQRKKLDRNILMEKSTKNSKMVETGYVIVVVIVTY